MLREVLTEHYTVECVGDVPHALAALEVRRPDVILLDCLLPGGRPDAVLDHAEKLGCAVVLTSGCDAQLERFAGCGYPRLCKPFRLGELEDAIATACTRRRAAG